MADNRADSVHVLSGIYKKALEGEQLPDGVTLEEKELPYWRLITEARAQWTKVDLFHAANLARCMCSIEENTLLLKAEGDVIKNDRGTMVMNPRFTILEQLSRRSVSLSAKIQVHAAATMGESKDQRKKNTAKRQALETMNSVKDDLIARPN